MIEFADTQEEPRQQHKRRKLACLEEFVVAVVGQLMDVVEELDTRRCHVSALICVE